MDKTQTVFLGIDPGTGRTGWGVIQKESNDGDQLSFSYVAHGCIVTEKFDTMPKRLLVLHRELEKIIKTYKPSCLIVEQLFFGRNIKTAISVSQARGVIMLTSAKTNLPAYEYTSISVKHGLSGNGRLEKKDIQVIVRGLLKKNKAKLSFNTKDKGFDDAADALAIAIHHVIKLHGPTNISERYVKEKVVVKKKKKALEKSGVITGKKIKKKKALNHEETSPDSTIK